LYRSAPDAPGPFDCAQGGQAGRLIAHGACFARDERESMMPVPIHFLTKANVLGR
jgi:hypothetical protein